ncbi:MAG: amidohydrolase family protein, partial [Chitinophagales bacterium]
AQWYANGGASEQKNITLEAINKNKPLTHIFETGNKLEILRADKIAKEFSFQLIVKGSGDEYQRIEEIKKTGAPLIIPVAFPQLPDVEDPFDANLLSIAQLKNWELAPANPAMLYKAGITFAITQAGLGNKNDFLKNMRKAIAYGLSEDAALAALTTVPAKLLGVEGKCGTLSKDKIANFIISTGPVFDEESSILQTWVNGKMYSVNTWIDTDVRGAYTMQIDNRVYGLLIQGTITKPKFSIVKNTDTIKAEGKIMEEYISLYFKDGDLVYRLNGIKADSNFTGKGQINEKWVEWKAIFANVYAEKTKEQKPDSVVLGKIMYPFTSYGWYEEPVQEDVLIANTTVWTNEKEGILRNYDVLISGGKIVKVGKNISSKNAKVIDGTGKHLTAGIIDEHSHIAISNGVNESAESVSAEVRIGDVINCDDINIYRQLSGGVTTSQLLHGSANAIGGQSAIVKLRWGAAPEEMKFEEAPGFIKFALGENVKQANWGDEYRVRFPQTRM